jgi:DNA-binding transcriptional LysR family regulator
MLDLRRLRYFVTIAEELHFGRAAIRLRIAQPPLTRHITALEAELGLRLFERSTRAVRLTPEGTLFLEQARTVLQRVDEAQAAARKMAQGVLGRLTIGYSSSIPMSDVFSDIIRHVSRNLSEVELLFREVSSVSQLQQIADATLDIGFGWPASGAAQAGIQSLIVSRDPLVVAVPSTSVHANKAAIDFADLAEETFLNYPPGYGAALNAALDELCARAGIAPRMGPTASQMTTLISLVAAERGVAIVPSFTSALQRSGVAYVPLAEPYIFEQSVVWREPFSSTCVERFVELVKSSISPNPKSHAK